MLLTDFGHLSLQLERISIRFCTYGKGFFFFQRYSSGEDDDHLSAKAAVASHPSQYNQSKFLLLRSITVGSVEVTAHFLNQWRCEKLFRGPVSKEVLWYFTVEPQQFFPSHFNGRSQIGCASVIYYFCRGCAYFACS